MFSKDITDSDAFNAMPLSSQCLYFHLWMQADDDWFLWNSKRIMRMVWCSDDDYNILLLKRFIIQFEWWVCVIKHRKINNTLRADRAKKTNYVKELQMLKVKENGSYTEVQPNDNQMTTKCPHSIVEDSIVEDSIVNGEKILFNKFWDLYNKKVWDKKKCKKKWDMLNKEIQEKIIDTLPSFLSTIKNKQFQPYPETYLNQERWENNIIDLQSSTEPISNNERIDEFKKLSDNRWAEFKIKYGKDKYFEIKKLYQKQSIDWLLSSV